MGEQFDRVAIVVTVGSTEYIVLEPQLIADYGHGQGPTGGVLTVKGGMDRRHGCRRGTARRW